MSLGLIVKSGRILTAKLLLGEPVEGITHCAARGTTRLPIPSIHRRRTSTRRRSRTSGPGSSFISAPFLPKTLKGH